ncbi:MAG TPA: MltR family transcriptional regulator [Longimicrobiaceae bacterium]|nr:MltR family transcriptional regulator [Longimicrobiaceae bacterium]
MDRFDSYAALLSGESDRGAALLAGEYLSSLLEDLLRAFLVDNKAVEALFKGYAPLSTFSGRIDVAFGVGLLRESTRGDLQFIRKIRNHVAHHPHSVAFIESPVKDWCLELPSTQQMLTYYGAEADNFRRDSRMQFILAVQFSMFAINKTKYEIVHRLVPSETDRRPQMT